MPNTALEDTENLELQTNNCSCTSTGEKDPDRLLVGEETTTKTTDINESFVNNSSAHKNKQNTPLSPPPPPPKEDSYSDSNMGHGSAHIPLYEGDEDPRRHWFVFELTWEANQVTDEPMSSRIFVTLV